MKNDYLSRKENIVLTTISLIHEMGVNNISMKEIGRREGVTEASLYKHFKSKEELLSAVMEYYEQYDLLIYRTLENSGQNAVGNLCKYFTIYAEYYSNYREITSLINAYDVLAYDSNFTQRACRLTEQKVGFITDLVSQGQKAGILNAGMSAETLAFVLLGSFERMISMWRMREYSFSLEKHTEEMIREVLAAFEVTNRK